MRMRHGDFVHLPYPDARGLAASGHVRIVDPEYVATREEVDVDYLFRSGWSPRRLTRTAWVQCFDKTGGAEISNFNAVRVGTKLGFDVIGVQLGGSGLNMKAIESCDVVILNNLHGSEQERRQIFDYLESSGKPYVKYDHDCYEEFLGVFQKSALNVFLSPMHQKFYEDRCGQEIAAHSVALPLCFDVSYWKKEGKHEPGTVLIVAFGKCQDNAAKFIEENPGLRYFVAGGLCPAGANVVRLDSVDYLKMPDIYSQFETVHHCPCGPCAGERVLFESVLSGCKVITNANAGHSSWSFDWRDPVKLRAILSRAPYQFWALVDGVLR